ncbi:MAG TPA: DUF3857 domain-containing protein [Candidatus Acidoferrales bacterium]
MNRAQRFFCATAFALVLVWAAAIAPRPSSAGDDWLPIPPADLALQDNPASPGAHAMILYRESAVNEKYAATDGASVSEYVRIKIFTQEGTDQANVEIPFVKESSNIESIRARTIRPDGGIVNFEGKPFEKIIEKRSGEKFLAKTFTLPDVQPGCIIEYKFRRQYKAQVLYDQSWTLSGDLFTREGRFSILPYVSDYESFPLNFRQFGLSAKATPERQTNGAYALTVHDIPGIADESYMPPLRTLQARVEFYRLEQGTPPNETQDGYWARVEKKWNDDLEHFINKKSVLEQEVSRIAGPTDSSEVKLRKIYGRVQQIRDLSMEVSKSEKEAKQENLKKNSNVEDMLHHGYGNGREMNFLLVGLARAAGFESAEVFVAPRNRNAFYPQLRDPSELGEDIVWARAGSQEYFLDPAAIYFPFGVLPWYETSTRGIRLGKKPNDFVDVPGTLSSEATMVRHADLSLDADGLATGKLTVDFTGQQAALWRGSTHLQDETGRKKTLEDDIKGWLPSGSSFELTKIDNWDKTEQPLHVEGNLNLSSFGSPLGRRILIPATIFLAPQTKAFQSAVRHNAIYFPFPNEEVDDFKFQAPAGYKIETVPATKTLKPGAVLSYDISASQQGSVAEVQRHLVINAQLIPIEFYPALHSFFNTVKSNDEVQIILQNAENAKN